MDQIILQLISNANLILGKKVMFLNSCTECCRKLKASFREIQYLKNIVNINCCGLENQN